MSANASLDNKLNGLNETAQCIILLVRDYPGQYYREDLIRETRVVTGAGLLEARKAFEDAHKSGLIQSDATVIHQDESREDVGRYYPVLS